jgi:hypothetical protein
MPTEDEKYQRLRQFLMTAFREAELAMVLRLNGYGDVTNSVPANLPLSQYAFQIVEALDARGWINSEFFSRLIKERPGRRTEIEKLERFWLEEGGTNEDDPGKPPQSPSRPPATPPTAGAVTTLAPSFEDRVRNYVMSVPGMDDPAGRRTLLNGLPPNAVDTISRFTAKRPDLESILREVRGWGVLAVPGEGRARVIVTTLEVLLENTRSLVTGLMQEDTLNELLAEYRASAEYQRIMAISRRGGRP